jgi:hypothetical protein
MIEKSIENAKNYGISYEIASKNIQTKDTLQDYPDFRHLKLYQ